MSRIHRKIERTAEQLAELKAVREQFQREKPTLEELVRDYGPDAVVLPQETYMESKALLHSLKAAREQAGLSLADIADRSGMDRAAISRLENGHQPNPTLDTLLRYASALGKQLVFAFRDTASPKA